MDLPSLPELLDLLQSKNVIRFDAGGVSVEFRPRHDEAHTLAAVQQALAVEPETENQRKDRLAREAAEEDALLFASAGGGGN